MHTILAGGLALLTGAGMSMAGYLAGRYISLRKHRNQQ